MKKNEKPQYDENLKRFIEEICKQVDYYRLEYNLNYCEVTGALGMVRASLEHECLGYDNDETDGPDED